MKRIITVATTGVWPKKKDNPNVPITPEEIAEDVVKCYKAGASVAHLHMRDESENGVMDLERFEKTVKLIKEECDIVINLTTSGDLNATDKTRMEHLIKLKPDMASFDCGSMNWGDIAIFENHPKFLEKLAIVMNENNVKPEIEIFDTSMIYNALRYVKKGLLKEPLHYQFVLGVQGGMAASIENLVYLKGLIPKNSTWSAFGIGKHHLPILMTTVAMGGHVRVGLEDALMFDKDTLATNLDFVKRAKKIIEISNLEVANSVEARQILGIK